jgi:uncharacterized protein YigA (DUF484 family)
MTDSLTAQNVARFLQEHPEFFVQHAELFSTIEVPHPHQARAISLGERQILTLRERLKDFEFRLAELVRNAALNELTTDKLNRWCMRMLGEPITARVPEQVAQGLAEQFNLQEVGMRLWDLGLPEEGIGEAVSDEVRDYANALTTPYCGNDTKLTAANWLKRPPASFAVLSLRPAPNAPAFGMLVLGSDDAERFAPDMGRAFLQTVGILASAALSRLNSSATSGDPTIPTLNTRA